MPTTSKAKTTFPLIMKCEGIFTFKFSYKDLVSSLFKALSIEKVNTICVKVPVCKIKCFMAKNVV
jgi:hypothetical protein